MERAWFNMHKSKREDSIRNITFAFCMLIPIILFINSKLEDVKVPELDFTTVGSTVSTSPDDPLKFGRNLEIKTETEICMGARIAKLDREREKRLESLGLSTEDIYVLQQIVFAESRGEPLEGQVAVVNVILNRMASEDFPDSAKEVIFDRRYGARQFTPARDDGTICYKPNGVWTEVMPKDIAVTTVSQAVELAVWGNNPIGSRLFFYAPKGCTPEELAKREKIENKKVIGNHIFY